MIDITWIDRGREPKEKPNPRYPNGVDVDLAHGARETCLADLPYPAKRCGVYLVVCKTCDYSAAITTAGRPDDPRSVKLPCQRDRRRQ